MRERRGRKRLLVVVSVVAATLASSVAAAPDGTAAGDPRLRQALDRVVAAGAPGAIALVRVGERTVRLTRGYGNVQSRTPIRASDRFRVGSLTKTFVATVVLQLVGERKLSLGDTVERWLPGLVPNGSAITVRQLLNMTSGLFDYLDDGDPTVLKPYLAGNFGYVWKPRKLVQIAVSHRPKFAPGAGWSYCNTCYVLLGLIVESVTDHPIGNELRRRIFAPLRLRGTSFDSRPRIAGRHAHGYERDRKQLVDVSALSPSFGWAAGAIVSTADDLANFYRALLRGRLLRPDLLQTMQATVAADPSWRYGLGLIRWPLPCGTVWGHGGDTAGYYALAFSSRDGHRQLVLLANAGSDTLSQRGLDAAVGVLATAHCG